MTPRTSMTLTNMRATAKRALCDSLLYWRKEFPAAKEGLDHAPGLVVICTLHYTTCRAGSMTTRRKPGSENGGGRIDPRPGRRALRRALNRSEVVRGVQVGEFKLDGRSLASDVGEALPRSGS
jgi:hypothetical protein